MENAGFTSTIPVADKKSMNKTMAYLSLAERILIRYNVEHPSDIDPIAIAKLLGADVKFRKLTTCDALIVGIGERAEIIADDRKNAIDLKFAICHELGHWLLHRGENLLHASMLKEFEANEFAADFLMPRFMLLPRILTKIPTISAVEELAGVFGTRCIELVKRLVDISPHALCLVCYGPNGINWYKKSLSWPNFLTPNIDLEHLYDNLYENEFQIKKYFNIVCNKKMDINIEYIDLKFESESHCKNKLTIFCFHPVVN